MAHGVDTGPDSGQPPDSEARSEDRPVCLTPQLPDRQVRVLVEKLRLPLGGCLFRDLDRSPALHIPTSPAPSSDSAQDSDGEGSDSSDYLPGLGNSTILLTPAQHGSRSTRASTGTPRPGPVLTD